MHSKDSRRVAGRTPLKVIGFVMLVGVALFCGFVGAAVVGAVFPRLHFSCKSSAPAAAHP